jgi:glucose-1-phosphate adenylyltransferase
MKPLRVLAFVMAGGKGTRLSPLTEDHPKPALPFGGRFRIIDFVLSNLWNSGLPQACVLLHYRPLPLARHLARRWGWVQAAGVPFVRALAPESVREQRFHGTADAVAKGLQAVLAEADLIAVFAADHIYRMDLRQMIEFHARHDADATVSAVPVALGRAGAFGVICADGDGRIRGFQEKPTRPEAMPGDPARAFASMGNYLFRPEVLRTALAGAAARGETDFGRHVLPRLVDRRRVFAYDFTRNSVPGVHRGEEPAYWRDVGTVDAYVEAQWDLLGPEPRFRLDNPEWPIHGAPRRAPGAADRGALEDSIFGPGAYADGAAVRHSVLQGGAQVGPGAALERCIVMEGARIECGVELRHTIVGSGNVIAGSTAGRRARPPAWGRTPAGMTVVPPRVGVAAP